MNAKPFVLFIFFLVLVSACALFAVTSLPVSQPTPVGPREIVPPAFEDYPVVMATFEVDYFLNEQLI